MDSIDDQQAAPTNSRTVRLNRNLVIGWALLFVFTIGLAVVVTVFKPSTEPVTQIFAGALLLAEIVLGARAAVRYRRLRRGALKGTSSTR
jgi:hypothetical membrane protein